MTVDIFGYKLDLEILILIGIVYLIMVVHILISVTNVKNVNKFIKEGFAAIGDGDNNPYSNDDTYDNKLNDSSFDGKLDD